MERLRGIATVERVFGEPVERDGALVIPVATLMGGGVGGSGSGSDGGDGEGEGSGEGGGFGFRATPAGAYVVRDGTVRWVPAVDPARMLALSGATALLAVLLAWLMRRTRAGSA